MTSAEPPIPFFRPALPPLDDYVGLLREIWESRMLSNFGTFAQRLEQLAAEYLGAPHVLSVVSGDIGLIVTLTALELPPGSPCFVSGFTFNSTINAALWADLRPVLVDIDPDTFTMDPDELAAALERWTGPGVILATHAFGNPCDSDRLRALAREHDCYLVFDAAHGYGSQRAGTPVGRLGDAEVFSLSGTKLVTTAEGGLVATPHDWLAERIAYLRAYGFQHDYESLYVGINGKISELHCALGLLTLAGVEDAVQRRAEILAAYRARLGDKVGWQYVRPSDRSTYKDISIRLGEHREAVERSLTAGGVQTKRYFLPLHSMKPYACFADGPLPQTESTYETTLCVPAFSELDEATLDRVARLILEGVEAAADR
ncbi:MAG: DegT/DnrJ/EryC1/StrS family aminotransferase [Acidimicrobiia bacterium]